MDMVLADHSSNYLYLKMLTALPHQLANPKPHITSEDLIAILGYPDKVVFDLEFGVRTVSIFHTAIIEATAS